MAKRRKKNKKRQSEGVMFPAPLAIILVLAAVLSLSYLWLCGRTEGLGRNIKGLEKEYAELRRRVINEEYKWSNMKSPKNIERLLTQHNVAMVWPSEQNIVRIRVSSGRTTSIAENQYAARSGNTMND